MLLCTFVSILLATTLERPPEGLYRATLETPGGPLPFGMEIRSIHRGLAVDLLNPPERIYVGRLGAGYNQLWKIRLNQYDSQIDARWNPNEQTFTGTWSKQRGDKRPSLPFRAVLDGGPRFPPAAGPTGAWPERWSVRFSSSEDPAVLQMQVAEDGLAKATFLTTTGDYRYLSGRVDADVLQLSCFDGAHAFLFKATRNAAGQLQGDFWSGGTWHETWTATPDADAQLPDAFEQTRWVEHDLVQIRFPDLDGIPRSLATPKLRGRRVTIIEVFGSWCPNCHDAAKLLAEFENDYGKQGLKILGLAFEQTGDLERDAARVRSYLVRHQLKMPVLLAGRADKAEASAALPFLDRVRSYPTLILLDKRGRCRGVYTGWTGPATGAAYEKLQTDLRTRIETLLGE